MSSEQDRAKLPQPVSEPLKKVGMSKRMLYRIAASFPAEYKAAAGVYTYLDNMTFRHLTNAAKQKNDLSEEISAEGDYEDEGRGLVEIAEGFIARKPGEALIVGPKTRSSQPLPTASNNTNLADNPFMQKPAEYKKAA